MKLIHDLKDLQPLASSLQPIILVGGTFDGVHLGHQALIRRAQEEASKCGGQVVIMTFDQHPAALLRPERAPRLLTTKTQKIKLLENLGVDAVLLLSFDATLAATPAEEFIQELAAAAHPLKAMCIGASWSFGQGGKGNLALLQELGKQLHFSVITIDPVKVNGEVVSSTRIRRAMEQGHLDEAADCLGRRYALTGSVVHGEKRGKELGFPTANLSIESLQLPPNGVYAVTVQVQKVFYDGIANIGMRPTIASENAPRSVEVHLFDFQGDLYGQEIKIELISFLRPEKKFADFEVLRLQIVKDIEVVKEKLRSNEWRVTSGEF